MWALAIFVFANVPYVIDGATPYANLGLVSVVSIMIIQTITSNTYGFYQAGAGRLNTKDALKCRIPHANGIRYSTGLTMSVIAI